MNADRIKQVLSANDIKKAMLEVSLGNVAQQRIEIKQLEKAYEQYQQLNVNQSFYLWHMKNKGTFTDVQYALINDRPLP